MTMHILSIKYGIFFIFCNSEKGNNMRLLQLIPDPGARF